MDLSELENLLLEQYKKYQKMQIEDMIKLLYQSEFGCGHMVSDERGSFDAIQEEAAALQPGTDDFEAVEQIGEGLCRLHLSVLRRNTLSPGTLNRFFMLTANCQRGGAEGFEEKVAVMERLCVDGVLPFDTDTLRRTLGELRAAGYPAMRHSARYREAYAPSYRVVDKQFCDFLPFFCRIDKLLEKKERVAIAIDGGCASGKSTLAALLKSVYVCNVFSMDDFFLRPSQRTRERLAEPGGNVDYERFGKEVMEPLLTGEPFSYRPYDCKRQELSREVRSDVCRLNIVEGAYSLHPRLRDAYDLTVFLKIEPEEQKRRLFKRNKEMCERFIREWIPLENKYFDELDISSKCDMVF